MEPKPDVKAQFKKGDIVADRVQQDTVNLGGGRRPIASERAEQPISLLDESLEQEPVFQQTALTGTARVTILNPRNKVMVNKLVVSNIAAATTITVRIGDRTLLVTETSINSNTFVIDLTQPITIKGQTRYVGLIIGQGALLTAQLAAGTGNVTVLGVELKKGRT